MKFFNTNFKSQVWDKQLNLCSNNAWSGLSRFVTKIKLKQTLIP